MSRKHDLLAELEKTCNFYGLNEGRASLAFELYMELCEVLKLWEVKHHFNEKFNIFFFTGKVKQNEEPDVYVPLTIDETLSTEYINDLQACLSEDKKSLILVFRDRDSSATYYRVTEGLIRPDSPTTSQRKKFEERKQAEYQRFLVKNEKKLYIAALKQQKTD